MTLQPHLPLQSPRHLLRGLDKKPEVSQMAHKFFWFRFSNGNMSQRQRTSFCFTGHQRVCNEVPALGVVNSSEILTLGVKTCTCQQNGKGGTQTLGPKSLQPSLTLVLPQDVSLKKKIICPAAPQDTNRKAKGWDKVIFQIHWLCQTQILSKAIQ